MWYGSFSPFSQCDIISFFPRACNYHLVSSLSFKTLYLFTFSFIYLLTFPWRTLRVILFISCDTILRGRNIFYTEKYTMKVGYPFIIRQFSVTINYSSNRLDVFGSLLWGYWLPSIHLHSQTHIFPVSPSATFHSFNKPYQLAFFSP